MNKARFTHGESGMTIVEVLAALSIFVVLAGSLYGILVQTAGHFQRLKDRNELSEQAAYITTILTEVHRKSQSYVIQFNPEGQLELTYENGLTEKTTEIGRDDYFIDVRINNVQVTKEKPVFIDLKEEENKSIQVLLTLKPKHYPENEVIVATTVSRMTAANKEEEE